MPLVTVRVTKDGVTAERKRHLMRGITELLRDVMGKDPKDVTVIIDEVEDDNWGIEGESVTERMKARRS